MASSATGQTGAACADPVDRAAAERRLLGEPDIALAHRAGELEIFDPDADRIEAPGARARADGVGVRDREARGEVFDVAVERRPCRRGEREDHEKAVRAEAERRESERQEAARE